MYNYVFPVCTNTRTKNKNKQNKTDKNMIVQLNSILNKVLAEKT